MAIKSRQEVYDSLIEEVQSAAPELTDDNEGSNIDIIAGVVSAGVDEIQQVVQDEFRKTYFDFAGGPEVTEGPDDLQTLAVDHFGDSFKRPGAKKALGIVTFSRPNSDAGDVLIGTSVVVKTKKTSAGNSVSFKIVSEVTMTGLSINASVEAIIAGPSGNVNAGTVTEIETSLSDSSITVTNAASFNGGEDAETDAEYRETIKLLLETLKGATLKAIEAKAKSVAGVVHAKAIEFLQYVKEWDILGETTVGDYFGIPRARIYIADANGNASAALISSVDAAIKTVRAAGVRVEVLEAIPVSFDWTAQLTLNPLGPNYGTFQSDLTAIQQLMEKYITDRPVGQGFSRADANAYILAKYGPTGSDDLSSFTTSVPAADVTLTANQKLLPGTVTING